MGRFTLTFPSTSPSVRSNGKTDPIQNEILLALGDKECAKLIPKLEFVRLRQHQVLYESGDALKSAYFCNSGMFSVLTVMSCGKSIEVGLIGKEGFAGLPLLGGFRTIHNRVMVQAEGSAFRVDADVLHAATKECPALERQMQRFGQLFTLQATQIATCNILHDNEERLARWLLMTQDRVGSETLPVTQEFVAEMLGTRRSTVTVSAGTLQKAGLIRYIRGSITIIDRARLKEAACECYMQLRQQTREWQNQKA